MAAASERIESNMTSDHLCCSSHGAGCCSTECRLKSATDSTLSLAAGRISAAIVNTQLSTSKHKTTRPQRRVGTTLESSGRTPQGGAASSSCAAVQAEQHKPAEQKKHPTQRSVRLQRSMSTIRQHNRAAAACTLHQTGKATGAAPSHDTATKTTTALHYGKDQKDEKWQAVPQCRL
jgi:hypothetical protein